MIIKLFLFIYYIINKWLSYFIFQIFIYLISVLNGLFAGQTVY